MTALVDLHRLARVCGLLGSEHDGEVLAAARQAEKIRKKLGVTWEELLVPSPRPRAADPPPEDLTDWRWACHFCLERYPSLTSWELNFVATVARYQKPPSAKQLRILHRLVARCRNTAA
ncbi:MAG: hypothetical protein ACJ8AW_12860 [Rhodopila sp.]